jgi:hypothetical protein
MISVACSFSIGLASVICKDTNRLAWVTIPAELLYSEKYWVIPILYLLSF